MTDKERAERWIRDEPVSSCPAGESLAREFAEVRAEARLAALEEAASTFEAESEVHRHVFGHAYSNDCERCYTAKVNATRIRSLMEPKETK